jgi:hypothetical protein
MSVTTLTESRVFGRRLEHTAEARLPGVKQNAFQHSPIAALMLGRTFDTMFGPGPLSGAGIRVQPGGESVRIQHNLGTNSTAQFLAGPWGQTDTTPSDTVRHSRANWIDASATVTISERERLENQGGNQIVPIIQHEIENAVLSLVDIVADSFYDQQTLGPTGLEQIASAGSETASVQGLSGSTYANWNSRGVSARGTAAASVSFASGSFSAQGVADMRTSYNNASEGALAPKIGLTTYSVLEFYEGQIVPQERYTSPQMGNLSFMNLAFKDAVVVGDPKCTSATLYWVNPANAYAVALAGANFNNGEAHRAEKQEATNMQIMWKGQLVTEDRRLVNKVDSITA